MERTEDPVFICNAIFWGVFHNANLLLLLQVSCLVFFLFVVSLHFLSILCIFYFFLAIIDFLENLGGLANEIH